MRRIFPIAVVALFLAACTHPNVPDEPKPTDTIPTPEPQPEPDPEGTIRFAELDSAIANPERGLYSQSYFTSADLDAHASAAVINNLRYSINKMTLFLHSYYLTDYMESDIPQEFFDRLEYNMNALREGGGKVILRFSYKSSMDTRDKPWNATAEWIHRHIDQIGPYLQKHSDVILCVQCGFLGSWGEWYYTDSGYKMNPSKDEDFEPRWQVLEHLLEVVPLDRQVALRTPAFKMRYLEMRGLGATPLTAEEAYGETNKARICGHNDCFVSSSSDVGTYGGASGDRAFWAADTKYTFMGGETCEKCAASNGTNALAQMKKYHWTYINRDYRESVTSMWRSDGTMDTMRLRIGYRLVLDKAYVPMEPKVGNPLEINFTLHNAGYAAPINKRDIELILVNAENADDIHTYAQEQVDPRLWLPEEVHKFTLMCRLTDVAAGQYKVYINLPDPYESLHNDPRYSIRLANKDMWDEATGYNYIMTIDVAGEAE